ncbi:filamentous hemagglutinin N-terminal domain-containing protein [Xylophilus sp. Kf1]|nr:filamentous hemagglutinin N-terminal domain-containing protein [Xylophilus sp. Kf1]
MNRHCFRVLFNRARGLFVVCQENARSAAGSPSASTAASAIRFASFSFVAAACALLCVDRAHGQIMADPSAPGRQRPTVLAAPNGVPVVNIQTPSAAGVSHNTYRQFDVDAPGAILNNSRGNVQTQLGGWVQGNPWLAKGPARVILQEVNSSNPSLLRGAVEVAGPRAEVIIANPSGITVDGGSFINASRVTLTTGSPVMNGGNLESYRVQRGNVLFEGRGLDAGATDYTAVLARAVQVNAGIWAKALKVVAGAHEASADGSVTTPVAGTGPAPTFLLDVAALGGMYAGHIFMAGTEAGLGVRNAGNIASTGTLGLAADGRLINSGSLLAQTDLSLQAGAIDNRGSVEAGGSARLASQAGDIGNAGGTVTARRLELQSAADIDNRGGNLRQTGAGVLQVAVTALDNSAGGTVGNRPAAESGGGTTHPTNPTGLPVDPVTPITTAPTTPTTTTSTTTPSAPDLTPGTIRARGILHNPEGKVTSNAGISLAAGRIDNSGGFVAVDRVIGPVVLSNGGGELRVTGDLSLTGAVLDNRAGTLLASGALWGNVGRADNTGGVVQATTLKLIADGDIDNRAGTLRATAATAPGIDIHAGGTLHNGAGQIESASDTTLSAGRVEGEAGRVVALGTLDIRTTGDMLARQSAWTAGGTLNASAGGTLDLRGAALDATQALRIDARALDNRGGRVVGGSSVAVATMASLLNDGGLVHAATGLDIGAGGALSNRAGSLESSGKTATLAIRATDIDNRGGRIVNAGTGATTVAATGALNLGASDSTGTTGPARTLLGGNGGVDITAGSLQVAAGSTVAASGALSLAVDGAAVNAGSIAGAGTVRLSAASLDNRAGRIEAADTLAVTSAGVVDNRTGTLRAGHALALNAGGDLSNDRGAIEAVATDATLSIRTAATLDNATGRIANAGTGGASPTILTASHIVNAATGSLLANGALHLRSATLDNQTGANIGAASLVLDVSDTATNRGTIASNGALAFVQTAATLDNRAGRVTAADAVDLQLQRLLNDAGSIATTQGSGALLALNAGPVTNTGGTLSSDGELRIQLRGDLTNDGLLHAGGDLGLNVAGALVNKGTLEAAGTLRTDSTSLNNRLGAVIQAGKVDLNTPGALVNTGEISGKTVLAHADSIFNTGGITGDDVDLDAPTITNTGKTALIGATGSVKLKGSEGVTNSEGATVYSAGDIGIQTAALVNRSATIEAGKDIAITATSVRNERPVLALGQTVALTENHTLTMPAWWHNNAQHASHYAGSVNGTSFNAHQVFYFDPADILENGSFVTPDGQVIGRAVVRTHADDTSYFSASAGFGVAYGHRERITLTDSTRVIYYTSRTDDVANPDQVAGAAAASQWPNQAGIVSWDTPVPVDAVYGRCSTRCVVLTQPWQYTDPDTTIIQSSQRILGPSTALYELKRDVTTRSTDDTIQLDAAARIAAGGNISIAYADSMTNRFGDVVAGGTLAITRSTPGSTAVDNEGITLYRRYQFSGTSTLANGSVLPWNQPDISQVIGTARGLLSGAQGVTITGQTVRNTDVSAGSAVNIVDAVRLTSGGRPAPAAATSSAAAAAQVGSTQAAAGAFINSPGALYNARPQPDVPYLYETRPAFANYRDWLSSDYLLKALGIDPAATQKRLGDGFYEQQLVIQQIEKLTGRRYLSGQASDLEQYRSLLESGVTYARQYGLVPGISLSAAQMAALTSDIVWLQSESVTLPDGSTQNVLVPHVYLARLGEGVLAGNGALITGNALSIEAGKIVNRSGVLGGAGTRKAVLVASADVLNQGGLISAGDLNIQAGGDIRNESLAVKKTGTGTGTIQTATSASNLARIVAGEKLKLDATKDVVDTGGQIRSGGSADIKAGRDVSLLALATGSTQTDASGQNSVVTKVERSQTSRIEAGGHLTIDAKRDIHGEGAQIIASGDARLTAGQDIQLGTVTESSILDRKQDADNHSHHGVTQETASSVTAGGKLSLNAVQDVIAPGVQLTAGGALTVNAGRDITLLAARDELHIDESSKSTSSRLLGKRTDTDSRKVDISTARVASLQGDSVTVTAGNNALLEGSRIQAQGDALVYAGNAVVAGAASSTDTRSESHSSVSSGLNLRQQALFGKSGGGTETHSNVVTAQGTSITSKTGNAAVFGTKAAVGEGVQMTAEHGAVVFTGGTVDLNAAVTSRGSGGSATEYGNSLLGLVIPSKGLGRKQVDTADAGATDLLRNNLTGKTVRVAAIDGDAHIAGTDINSPGTLTVAAPKGTVFLDGQQTTTSQKTTHSEADLVYGKSSGAGGTEQTTQYNRFNVGSIQFDTPAISAQIGSKDSVEQLARQPGMDWVRQLVTDPALSNKVDWTRLQDASDQWDYQQQGLTSVGAVIVTAAVAYFTFGAASGLGAAAGDAAAVGAGQGVALTGGGAFLTGSGAAIAGVVGGASTAALTALAAQAAIAVANNPTDPGKALKQLGSSANVRGLVAALLTGGVLAGLNLAPTGVPTAGAGAQAFGDQLWQNLRAGAARAVINTAVYGGSLEGALKAGLLASIVDTGAAQTAFAIGDLNLDAYTGKVAHALAGCAAGAARSGGSCQAGALGAVIGEISGEQFGFDDNGNIQPGAIEMASMLGAVGAALAGMDASQVALAAAAAGNAAANNALSHYVEKALGKLKNTLRSLELKPLADSQKAVSEYLDSAAARGGLNETEIAALATLYAANEVLFPTSVLDAAGPIGKAVGKAGRLIKAGGGANEAAATVAAEVRVANAVVLTEKSKNFYISVQNLSAGERVALIKQESKQVAGANGWVKDNRLTRINDRDVYSSPDGNLYALDTQHASWEVLNSKGIHLREVRLIDLQRLVGPDTTNTHNLVVK